MKTRLIWLIVIFFSVSCSLPHTPKPPASTQQTTSSVTPPPAVTETPPPLSLDAQPLVWFAPLPPLAVTEGRSFTGSDDFMALFEEDAPWQTAASHIQVFKLYGEWVACKAVDTQLTHAEQYLEQHQAGVKGCLGNQYTFPYSSVPTFGA